MTAAAARTCAATSPTEAIRSRRSDWTRVAGATWRFAAGEGGKQVERKALRVDRERVDEVRVVPLRRPHGTDQCRDGIPIEWSEDDCRRPWQAGKLVGRHRGRTCQVLSAPRQQHEDRPAAQATGEVGQGFSRGIVDEVEVVDPDQSRHRAAGQRGQGTGDRLQQAHLGPGTIKSGGSGDAHRNGQFDEATDFATSRFVKSGQPRRTGG